MTGDNRQDVTNVPSVIPTKGERTRRRVLDLAISMFGQGGYRATSVAAIARAAGITPAAVFAYWRSKEALFESAVDADAKAVIEELTAAPGRDDSQIFDVLSAVDHLYGILRHHGLARRILAGEEPEVIDRVLELDAFDQLRARLALTIKEGQDGGTIRTDLDPASAAIGLETLILSLTMALLQLRGVPDPSRISGVTALVSAALRMPDPTAGARR
jgi:AcrR family transcriptional regulator